VAGNRQAVQGREGGVVTAIHVQEGQSVARGQILVELSASELRASERGMTGEILPLLAQRARLVVAARRRNWTRSARPAANAQASRPVFPSRC